MAAGDFSFVGDNPKPDGDEFRWKGTCEVDDTGAEFDINCLYITSVQLIGRDTANSARVILNSNDGTADTENGSFWAYHDGNGVHTFDMEVRGLM